MASIKSDISVKLTGNQSVLKRGVNIGSYKVRMFIEDGLHTSGNNNRDIAKYLSQGDPEKDMPARPFFRQFWSENGKEIKSLIQQVIKDNGISNLNVIAHEAANMIEDSFHTWVLMGGVSPENAPSTLELKGPKPPLVDTGELLRSVRTEVETSAQ